MSSPNSLRRGRHSGICRRVEAVPGGLERSGETARRAAWVAEMEAAIDEALEDSGDGSSLSAAVGF